MFIAIDFDGTCVKHAYPKIGEDIGAIPVLKQIAAKHKLILYTMRSGEELKAAVQWFKDNEIPLYGINENPTQKWWTTSPKIFAHLYIDDMALGCPCKDVNGKKFVDWEKIKELLKDIL